MKLGRYEIVRELGKGAMGVVYLAKDPLIGRLVALKTIRMGQSSDDDDAKEFQQRFVREAQAAGMINHPSIVTVHDIGQDEVTGTSFIAMEFVEGNNLREVLQQGKPLTFDQIGDIVAQIADALDFAHAKGIVHRDVKPANIILLDGLRAKITDFGIAKIASGGANLTSTGQFLGTPNYMAPEQIKGAPVDGRTDIFALGICLYECLTRRKPFGGDSLTAISYKIVHEPFPPLREINPQIPAAYEEVIAKCLEKEPGKRFQRARDVAAAIRSVIKGEKPNLESNEAEATILTRGSEDRTPTMEVPHPDGSATNPNIMARPAAGPSAIATHIKKTVDTIHSLPVLGIRIPAAAFIAIVIVLFAGLGVTMKVMKAKTAVKPAATVDPQAEAQRAKERDLRTQANNLLRNGRAADAIEKYQELLRIAPNSPAINERVQQLSNARAQAAISHQQVMLAAEKFDQAMSYYNDGDFASAIPLLNEAYALNPNSEDIAKYLKSAQDQQAKNDQAKAARPGIDGSSEMLTDSPQQRQRPPHR